MRTGDPRPNRGVARGGTGGVGTAGGLIAFPGGALARDGRGEALAGVAGRLP